MKDSPLCPSARCEAGAVLLGIVLPNGTVAFAHDRIVVTEEFVEAAGVEQTPPEQRFRFSNLCVSKQCKQWTGSRCGVIDKVIELVPPDDSVKPPACSIRPQCRWFVQVGIQACKVCPVVITDSCGEAASECGASSIAP